ncbi:MULTISPECIES: ABC transporter permease [unclassified Saccharothrix]|uniref:ABC transporter permease n=1 Tax=unclassified Saccharothrix TaxID=2593673 RepID=UPI00307EE739
MTSWSELRSELRALRAALDDRTTWQASLIKAVLFEVSQHARNRLALALVVFFIPSWLGLVKGIIPSRPVDFHSAVADRVLTVPANQLAMISGAINAVTLIIGFMMFAAVRRSSDFDQRLVLAGYSRPCLLTAKLVALVVISGAVAAYAGVLMTLFWDPLHPWLLGFSLFMSGLTYGGMGIVLGLVLSTELAGMFVIIMISLVDVMVQNPVINPSSNQDVVRFLPTYGAMQTGAAAGFTDQGTAAYASIGLLWLAGFGCVGMAAFYLRTKDHARHAPDPEPRTSTPAVVTVAVRADGTLEVRSTSGPVVVCSHLLPCETKCEVPAPRTKPRAPRRSRTTTTASAPTTTTAPAPTTTTAPAPT